jgi:competence protein ComEA
MADEGPPLGVSTAAQAPANWPGVGPTVAPPASPEPPAWTPAAVWTAVTLLVAFLGLLGWRGYGMSSYSTRPLPVEGDPAPRRGAIDVNKADAVDLRLVPGVGEGMAQRIIEHRGRLGGFRSLDELRQVKGVGEATLQRIRPYLRVGPDTPSPPPPPRVVRAAAPEKKAVPARAKGKKQPPAGKVDVNRAGPDELRTLPGIGPTLARRILEARQKGPFRSVDELRRVKGVGPKTLERLRPFVRVGPGE